DGDHGWGTDPWLPFPPHAGERSVEALREDPDSILHLYRRLLGARRASAALALGDQRLLDLGEGIVGIERTAADGVDRRLVLVSFTDTTTGPLDLPAPPDGKWIVEVSTDGAGEGEPFTGVLGPDQAVVLR
ncbi:hypothetical protein B7486_77850, partial [cyanobacterium TDX16]